ncbi:MAG: M23 family metallopeptidase [Myxococcota bacterium]
MTRRLLLIMVTIISMGIGVGYWVWLGQTADCIVGQATCPSGMLCSKGVRWPFDIAHCVDELPVSPGEYDLPLLSPEGVICTQQGQAPTGSHGFLNTLFALDLTSPLAGPPGTVLAARDGIIIETHRECPDSGFSSGYHDDCGHGFGNFIVIDHGDKTAAFYAHLAAIKKSTGSRIVAGEVLGTEGTTGQAGHRHLHFSVHTMSTQLPAKGMLWRSIPFRLKYRSALNSLPMLRDVSTIQCKHNDFSQRRWF